MCNNHSIYRVTAQTVQVGKATSTKTTSAILLRVLSPNTATFPDDAHTVGDFERRPSFNFFKVKLARVRFSLAIVT